MYHAAGLRGSSESRSIIVIIEVLQLLDQRVIEKETWSTLFCSTITSRSGLFQSLLRRNNHSVRLLSLDR